MYRHAARIRMSKFRWQRSLQTFRSQKTFPSRMKAKLKRSVSLRPDNGGWSLEGAWIGCISLHHREKLGKNTLEVKVAQNTGKEGRAATFNLVSGDQKVMFTVRQPEFGGTLPDIVGEKPVRLIRLLSRTMTNSLPTPSMAGAYCIKVRNSHLQDINHRNTSLYSGLPSLATIRMDRLCLPQCAWI